MLVIIHGCQNAKEGNNVRGICSGNVLGFMIKLLDGTLAGVEARRPHHRLQPGLSDEQEGAIGPRILLHLLGQLHPAAV